MSYTALYRKWRPVSFEDVKGQDAIVQTLKNQITSQRIGHAYLFCGTRGTGKTSVAKIYARAVNCEHPAYVVRSLKRVRIVPKYYRERKMK